MGFLKYGILGGGGAHNLYLSRAFVFKIEQH